VLRSDAEFLHFGDEAVYAAFGLDEVLNNSIFTKQLAFSVHCFGDAVRVEKQLSAGAKREGGLGIGRRTEAEGQSGVEVEKGAVTVDDERWQMRCTGHGDLAC